VASIAKIKAVGDVQEFRKQVHALRSATANIGARGIYAICPACNRFRPRIWPNRGGLHLKELRDEFERVSVVLRGILSKQDAAA